MEKSVNDFSKYDDIDLLIACIRGEAEAENLIGKFAIACVVRNRVQDPRWPDTYREVILQPKQFSCFNQGLFRPRIMKHDWKNMAWKECKLAACGVYQNYVRDVTDEANLYWNPKIIEKPNWDWSKIRMLKRIGGHQFCREI